MTDNDWEPFGISHNMTDTFWAVCTRGDKRITRWFGCEQEVVDHCLNEGWIKTIKVDGYVIILKYGREFIQRRSTH
jgi:hypothetical protein